MWNDHIAILLGGDSFVITGVEARCRTLMSANSNTLTFSYSGVHAVWRRHRSHHLRLSRSSAANFNIVNGNTEQAAALAQEHGSALKFWLAAVEDLTAGDSNSTEDGRAEPIVWIGSRTVNCARHPTAGNVV